MDMGPSTARAATEAARRSVMESINRTLPRGWEAKMMASGRLYYQDHSNARSQWLPPVECWPLKTHLPYGWESAITDQSMQYYINHQKCVTTSCHPYILQSEEPAPTKRLVTLNRDSVNGFGFIAGSESPVVVRSVTEGGPSADKLLPGDHILEIAGEDVTQSKRMYIIDKIMNATDAVQMLVMQPNLQPRDGVSSSFLSHNKKQKLMARPLRVRFADNIKTFSPNPHKVPASLSYLPNILKVYLENGQTKSFRYDGNTTVKNVLESISTKLGIESPHHFALVTEDVRLSAGQKFHILSEDMALRQVSSQPESQYWRCLYRLTFPPRDAYELLLHDSAAFDYFYQQCRNDVICERFGSELKFDLALRLASLSVQQHYMKVNKKSVKVSAKMLQKQDGLELFLPRTILESYKGKELRKQICLHLKQNQTFTPPGQKCLSEVQAKLHYLKIIAALPSYTCRTYISMTSMHPGEGISKTELPLTVSPTLGICRVRSQQNEAIVGLDQLEQVVLSQQPHLEASDEEAICQIEIECTDGQKHQFVTSGREGVDFVNFVCGLHKVYVDKDKTLLEVDNSRFLQDPNSDIPKYSDRHVVVPASWNYPDPDEHPGFECEIDFENIIDLSTGPPAYTSQLEASLRFPALPKISSQESNISRGEETDEETTDTGSMVSLSDTQLSMTSEENHDRRSVISLTDMSFDIQETSEGEMKKTENGDEKMSQLLVILNEESKEMLDGTAKLRMRLSPGDVVKRKTSLASSECSSVSSLCSSNPEYSSGNLGSPVEEPDMSLFHLIDTDMPGVEPTPSSAQGYVGGDEDDNINGVDDIPVSLIDMPSPDPLSPSDKSNHFDYQTAHTSSENISGQVVTAGNSLEANSEIDQFNHHKRNWEMGESSGEETFGTRENCQSDASLALRTGSMSSGTVNESLESIAASFQSTEDQCGDKGEERSRSTGLRNPGEEVEESLDDLVESFRIHPQDSEVTSYHVANCRESVSNGQDSKEESLQGLVDALIEVAHVVDYNEYSKLASVENGPTSTNKDQNGNFESTVQLEEQLKSRLAVVEKEDSLISPEIENVLEDDDSRSGGSSSGDRNSVEGGISSSVDVVSGEEGQEMTDSNCDSQCIQELDVIVVTTSVDSKPYILETVAEQKEEVDTGWNIATAIDAEDNSTERGGAELLGTDIAGDTVEHGKDCKSPFLAGCSKEKPNVSDHIDTGNPLAIPTSTRGPGTLTRRGQDQSELEPQSLDEAHGIQLAALLALDASLEDKTPEHPRVPLVRDEEGSDSGNETISSECVDGPSAEEPSNRDPNPLLVRDNVRDNVDASVSALPIPPEYLEAFPPLGGVAFLNSRGVNGKSSYSEQGFAIDNETLESMRTVLCSSSPSDIAEVSSIVGVSNADTVGERDATEDDSSSKNDFDSFIASLSVQPPLEFDNSFSEDLLPVLPPPCLDRLYKQSEKNAAALTSISVSKEPEVRVNESMTTLGGAPGKDGEHLQVEAESTCDVGQRRVDTTGNSEDCNIKEKQTMTESARKGSNLSAPTPPPRKRNSRKGLASRGGPKSSSCKEKAVEKAVLRRSITYSSGDVKQPLEVKKLSVSDKQPPSQSPASTPRQKALGESLSKVFSPVMSWSSFKESFRLSSSKPRTRTSLKSLWPETTSSCFEDELTSKSMENIHDGTKGDESGDVSTEVRLREKNAKVSLRRCESLGGNLQSVTPGTFMADEVSDGTVVFPAEFWRKARQSAPPSPGRAPPPRPDCPPLTLLDRGSNLVTNLKSSDVEEDPSIVDSGSDSDTSLVAPPLPPTAPPTSSIQFDPSMSSGDGNVRGSGESFQQGCGNVKETAEEHIRETVKGNEESEERSGASKGSGMASQEILNQLEQKEYSGTDGVTDAYMDIQILCHTLEVTQTEVGPEVTPERFNRLKERLMLEIREFTGNGKALVTSLNHSAERLTLSMNHCMHTLTRLVQQGQQIVWSLHSELIASRLKHKICDLADHFTTLLQLVVDARGKANSSNLVQDVLRQAQTMAVLLSSLMRSVRMMQNYKQVGDKIII